jgi:arsenite methyltransferase
MAPYFIIGHSLFDIGYSIPFMRRPGRRESSTAYWVFLLACHNENCWSRRSCLPQPLRVALELMHDSPTSNHLRGGASDTNPETDSWSEWMIRRRHGGDPNHERVIRCMVQRIRDRVLDGAELSAGMVLVDVGTGDGLIALGAFERVGPSLKAVFTDVSAPLLKRAEEFAVERGVRDHCVFLQTPAERLDGVADESADALTTRAVIAYVADKAAAARQFHRVLKPGGRISIGEPIFQDNAMQLTALTQLLLSHPPNAITAQTRLLQRCRAAQLPSTLAEIQSNPLTSFSERDLIVLFQKAGFTEIHLELHIDIRKAAPVPWDTFIDTAPRPDVPTLREIFASRLSDGEQRQFEEYLRPLVESGRHTERDAIAYLTAVKTE